MSPAAARREISRGQIAPVYLFHGPESFERGEVLDLLVDAAVDKAARAFNLDVLTAAELSIDDAIGRITAFPMMAKRRMVVIRRIDDVREDDALPFLPVIARPVETTVLVFTAERIDGRRRFYIELKKAAVTVEFSPPKEEEVPGWIGRRVRLLGKSIDPEAARRLAEFIGPRPAELANEIEKLNLHTAGRSSISHEDVDWIVSASGEVSVFTFTKAVADRDSGAAFTLLQSLTRHGQSEVGMVALLARHMLILLKARALLSEGTPQSAMASRLKVYPSHVREYLSQARAFTDAQLRDALTALLEADDRLKLRSRTADAVMAQLVRRICRGDLDTPRPPG
jgi:DNA polymerase-3 subunit delta